MIAIASGVRVLVATKPVDFRRGADSLAALAREALGQDPYTGTCAGVPHHSNTIENYFSVLKRGINGTFHHVSEAHLSRYLAEFDFRYSNRSDMSVTDAMRAAEAVRGVVGKRLTYDQPRKAA